MLVTFGLLINAFGNCFGISSCIALLIFMFFVCKNNKKDRQLMMEFTVRRVLTFVIRVDFWRVKLILIIFFLLFLALLYDLVYGKTLISRLYCFWLWNNQNDIGCKLDTHSHRLISFVSSSFYVTLTKSSILFWNY